MKPSPASPTPPTDQLYCFLSELDVPIDLSLSSNPSFNSLRELLRQKDEKRREIAPFHPPLSENRLSLPLPQSRFVPRKLPNLIENRSVPPPRFTVKTVPKTALKTVPKTAPRALPKPEAILIAEDEKNAVVELRPELQEWRGKWEWSADLGMMNRHIFRNEGFRENQEEAMNAILSGRDVFICMPTGSGKSLTFQLPALINPGITIVVMPLISLLHDQVEYLRSISVKVIQFDSFQKASEQHSSFTSLESTTDTHLLYLTPEKLAQNDHLLSILSRLHSSNHISRLVVDEAHCISKWGRDFRADYLKLSLFRRQFPGVPILALTATATDEVKRDVIEVLGMRDTVEVVSSFNRKNLVFAVREKTKNAISDLAAFIAGKHANQTGIVYCLSRKDCERVSKELSKTYHINAGYYHAKMKADQRTSIHQAWMRESVKVLCATVAFGMGIHKANVRFVVHFSIPKSVESYYQEAGRAGRDGRQADCVVFYWYADKARQERLGSKGTGKVETTADLMKMVRYCEDVFTCRRQQQLAHFGEAFDPSRCRRTCDNCLSGRVPVPHDLTPHALLILRTLQSSPNSPTTLKQMTSLLTGDLRKSTDKTRQLEAFGGLKWMSKCDVERFLHQLLFEEVLCESGVRRCKFYVHMTLQLGHNANAVLDGRKTVTVKYENQRKVTIPCMAARARDLQSSPPPYTGPIDVGRWAVGSVTSPRLSPDYRSEAGSGLSQADSDLESLTSLEGSQEDCDTPSLKRARDSSAEPYPKRPKLSPVLEQYPS